MGEALNSRLEIDRAAYEWTARVFRILQKMLRLNVALHQTGDRLRRGEIFLFNHFARFETFIPQYLIFDRTGALCRSVATSELFAERSAFSNYLLRVGAVPNNHPRLLAFLAEEILRGRKVIIFPEGGMVKDRKVMDPSGGYSVYSRTAGKRRKHHLGAALLGTAVDLFKAQVLRAHKRGDKKRLRSWVEVLRLESEEALLASARRPTLIVPANITFYPLRIDDNILRKGAELLSRGLSRRLSEELLIEGNILLKDTDMDIRLAEPVRPSEFWPWWERKLAAFLRRHIDGLDDLFQRGAWRGWSRGSASLVIARRMRRRAEQIRDRCMQRMYAAVTVNLSHLASRLIMALVQEGTTEIDQPAFHKTLYLAIKEVQKEPSIHFHRSLQDPEAYAGLLDGQCPGLEQLVTAATRMKLAETDNGRYRFLPKLFEPHELDEIRRENLIAVYANEAEPLPGVSRSVRAAIRGAPALGPQTLAHMRFDDELLAHAWDRRLFSAEGHREINAQETATESGAPFLFLPDTAKELGVLLVHGFGASPAEVKPLGERLQRLGYPVLGVRLKGHGTSPWDLRERHWQDWLESARRGYAILSAFARRICLIGFSAGGALSLRLAAESPTRLAGVAAVSAPLRLRDRAMIFVPLVHRANRFLRSISSHEGIMPFRAREPEHPHINYRNLPIESLYELRLLMDSCEARLPDVRCPAIVIQGSDDPTVEPESAELIYRRLGARRKELVVVPATRHGILYENIGGTQEAIISFLSELEAEPPDHGASRK